MSQHTTVAEVEPAKPGADEAASPGAVAKGVVDGGDRPDTDLSPKARAALVKLAKLLGRQAAEQHISQGYST